MSSKISKIIFLLLIFSFFISIYKTMHFIRQAMENYVNILKLHNSPDILVNFLDFPTGIDFDFVFMWL